MFRKNFSFLFFFFLSGSSIVLAQVNARLIGPVIDASGAAVGGTSVDLYLPVEQCEHRLINGLLAQNTNVTLDGVNIQDNFTNILERV